MSDPGVNGARARPSRAWRFDIGVIRIHHEGHEGHEVRAESAAFVAIGSHHG
jgi:hypothetical protein